jgi:hypothetical protein
MVELGGAVLMLFNASVAEVMFRLPAAPRPWVLRADTAEPGVSGQTIVPGDARAVASRALAVFTRG